MREKPVISLEGLANINAAFDIIKNAPKNRGVRKIVADDGSVSYVRKDGSPASKPGRKAGVKMEVVKEYKERRERTRDGNTQMNVAFKYMNVELPDLGKFAIRQKDIIDIVAARTGTSMDSCSGTLVSNKNGLYSGEQFSQWVSCRISNLTKEERDKLSSQTLNGLEDSFGNDGRQGLLVHREVLDQYPNIDIQLNRDFNGYIRQEEREHIFSFVRTDDPSIVLLPSEYGKDAITAQIKYRNPDIYCVEKDRRVFDKYVANKAAYSLNTTDYCGTLLNFLRANNKQFTLINYDGAQYFSPTSHETLEYIDAHKKSVWLTVLKMKVVGGFRGNSKLAKEWRVKYRDVYDKDKALLEDTLTNYRLVEAPREWKTKADGSRTMRAFIFKLR